MNGRVLPVILRLKETAVKKWDPAVEIFGKTRVRSFPIGVIESIVEEYLKIIVVEILFFIYRLLVKIADEILVPLSPGFILRNTQPSLLLQKIQENNLPQGFLGKVGSVDLIL